MCSQKPRRCALDCSGGQCFGSWCASFLHSLGLVLGSKFFSASLYSLKYPTRYNGEMQTSNSRVTTTGYVVIKLIMPRKKRGMCRRRPSCIIRFKSGHLGWSQWSSWIVDWRRLLSMERCVMRQSQWPSSKSHSQHEPRQQQWIHEWNYIWIHQNHRGL